MAQVVANPIPCDSCRATGRCVACGGSGELPSGDECLDCGGGLCFVCSGTGRDLEYLVDGAPVSRFAESWTVLLRVGVTTLVFVPLGVLIWFTGEPAWPGLPIMAVSAVVGGLIIRWAIQLRDLQRQTDRLFGEFYAGSEDAVDAAIEALEERRKQRRLE